MGELLSLAGRGSRGHHVDHENYDENVRALRPSASYAGHRRHQCTVHMKHTGSLIVACVALATAVDCGGRLASSSADTAASDDSDASNSQRDDSGAKVGTGDDGSMTVDGAATVSGCLQLSDQICGYLALSGCPVGYLSGHCPTAGVVGCCNRTACNPVGNATQCYYEQQKAEDGRALCAMLTPGCRGIWQTTPP
jgi:hypothetical protein